MVHSEGLEPPSKRSKRRFLAIELRVRNGCALPAGNSQREQPPVEQAQKMVETRRLELRPRNSSGFTDHPVDLQIGAAFPFRIRDVARLLGVYGSGRSSLSPACVHLSRDIRCGAAFRDALNDRKVVPADGVEPTLSGT